MKYNLFWIRVQKILKMQQKTMVHLAQYLGIDNETMRSWIYWNHIPNVVVACRISEFTRVSVEYLVGGKEYYRKRILANETPFNLFSGSDQDP